MSNSYVTAGGSNGYTGTANVKLTGGNIGVYQTVNRGTLDSATVRVTGSTIGKFYVGGETEDKSVTGVINKINSHLVSGTIESLDSGTSNGSPITIYNKQKKEQKCETDFNCPTFFRFSTSKHLTQQSNC